MDRMVLAARITLWMSFAADNAPEADTGAAELEVRGFQARTSPRL